MIGGFNSNQILPYLDFEVIKQNPKIFCGFSDITALLDAIYAKTGLVTFSGPHLSSIGMLKGCEYTIENMVKMLMKDGQNEVGYQNVRLIALDLFQRLFAVARAGEQFDAFVILKKRLQFVAKLPVGVRNDNF